MIKNEHPIPTFEALFDMAEIQEIQDSFAMATGVASIITDVHGRPITKPSNFCRLCENIIRKSEKGRLNCIQSDAVIGRYHPNGPIIQTCLSGGLWDAGASISVAGNHIANWLAGQVRNEKTNIESMMKYARVIGADSDEFAKAFDEVTVMSMEQFQAVSKSLFLIANQLSGQAYQKVKQSQSVQALKQSESRLSTYKIQLEATVNQRTQELKASNDALKKIKATLEKKIDQRTCELKQKNEYLSALHETSLGMFSRLDLSQVLEGIVKRASSLTQIPDGFILIYDPDATVPEIKAGCGKYSQLKGIMLSPGEELSGRSWENGDPLIVNNYPVWPEKSKNPCFNFITSIVSVPLTSGSKIEGAIVLSHHEKGKRIQPEIIAILDQFAELAAIAIDNSKLLESMKKELDKRILLEDEREKMEARLRQSQKLEAIGTLARGIAHDFNNILFPILGFSEMIMHDLPDKSPIRNQLQPVIDSALRAKDLVRQILTFSRETEKDCKPLKLQFIIKEALTLARASLPSNIKIIKDAPRDIGMVMANPTQIHQILMNLISNALHSMEENGGELTVSLKEIDIQEDASSVFELTPGQYICLKVTDTGPGMDQSTLKRIFEPYFTTKSQGKGTGLGLSAVHGIVKNLNGEITAQSIAGAGSSFSVYLPKIINIKGDTDMKTISIAQLTGDERILLIDDEKPVLNILGQVLSRFGYKVTSHSLSSVALECFRKSPTEFDLVITDMTMPELSGDKLAMEIKKVRPDLPVILCTGFNEKDSPGRVLTGKPDKILMKPTGRDELLKNIRYLLDN